MNSWKLPTMFKTPLGVVFVLVVLIMLVELLIMSVIHAPLVSTHLSIFYQNLIDAVLLTLIISPVLYSLVFKRLKSDELLRQINASTQEAIVIVDEQNHITDWNPAAQRRFQYTREEAIGKQVHLLLAPAHYHTDAQRGFADFQKTGKGPLIGILNEVTAIRKDGSEFPVELSVTAFKVKGCWHAVGVMRDISERKRAKDTLRASEEKFSTIFESNPAMIAIGTTDGTIVDVNLSYADFLGYTRQEMKGKSLADLGVIGEDELQSLLVPDGHAGDSLRNVEVILRTHGGNLVNVLLSAEYVSLNGTPYRLATLQDITARKQAENALAASEVMLKEFIQHTPAAIAMLDTQMRYIQTSERWIRDYHLSGQNIIGKSHYEIFPDVPQHWKGIHQRVLAGAIERCNEDPFPRADGSTEWLQWEAHPWHKAGGEIGGIVFFTQVITERKRTEDSLREKELLLSESQRIAHVGSWRYDLSGQLTWSDEMFRIYGVSSDTFTPSVESLLNLIHPADRPAMQVWIGDCLAGNKPGELTFRISHPDGSERVISGSGELRYDVLNRPNHLIGIVYDITERKLTEAKLNEQLDELRRWHDVTSGREGRILDLKHEVNELLGQTGNTPRYPSAESEISTEK